MSPTARIAVFVSVALTIWALEHCYIGWRLLGLSALSGQAAHRATLALLVAGFLAYPLAQVLGRAGGLPTGALTWAGAVWMGMVFLFLASFLAVDVVTLGGLILKPGVPTLRSAAALLALLASLVAVAGGHLRPRVLDLEVTLPGLPAACDGLTLVQVSDLHLGMSVGERALHRVVDRVLSLKPDLIAVTGDVVDGSVPAVEPMLPELRRLRAPLGVLAVLGNHEYYAGADASRALLRAAGYTVLDNAALEVAPGLFVAGVPDARGARQTGQHPFADLAAALARVPPGVAVVLLQHSPEQEAQAAAAGVGLVLSGHTHGGQIWPFHYAVRPAYPHLAGVYRVGPMTEVVSRGAGLWGPPMRLFAPADVVRVTLRSGALKAGGGAPPA